MQSFLNKVSHTLSDVLLKDIRIFDFRGHSPFYDYQIVASGTNERQVHAAIEHIKKALDKEQIRDIVGGDKNRWVCLDLNSIIVHVMHEEDRGFYNIEELFIEKEEVFIEDVNV